MSEPAKSWARAHLDELRRQLDALEELAAKTKTVKGKLAIAELAEKLERRTARLARELAREEAMVIKAAEARTRAGEGAWARAQQLYKSKSPRDLLTLGLNTIAGLPIDLEHEAITWLANHVKERTQ